MKRGIITINALKRVLKPVLGIVCAILLNILGNRLVGALIIPLFIDNVGTILASVMEVPSRYHSRVYDQYS